MSRPILLVIVGLLAVLAGRPYIERLFASPDPRPVAARGDLAEYERATIELFKRVSPSVVQVVALPDEGARSPFDMQPGEGGGGGGQQSGTGFIWDRSGHIVTNAHVVQNASSVAIRFASGAVVRAEIAGLAPNYDLAVLRVRAGADLPAPVLVGRSDDLQVGQSAFAIGNPFGLDQSLTTGVISALKRRLPTSGGREIQDVIQTDAAINPGNSGGPLLDSAGRVIGVNTAIYSPSGTNAGIGFAIPIDIANRVVTSLIATGRVPTPGIGIVAADEAMATRLGVEGVIVVRVAPGSPAEQAGLQGVDPGLRALGDVIVGVNGQAVRRLSDLTRELERVGVGKSVTLEVNRANRGRRVTLTIADIGRR
ncbi:S1C family serine protease [Enterovirga rhinocerotis]|uniref:2-alkenal reductase n=1 Tax=Enterovirga rhinocerotis TaxID=1339210 RepID=A0A4R7BSZ1_9HYPH|nr:trypsin-like peptidase domain-containing protein [Enterovirga rhinocerotis]TDR88022.1 2-alkenal reductase [Enterovirga rhinocerotis]